MADPQTTDPLAAQPAIPVELEMLRLIARDAEDVAPMSAASMRVLLRHITWLEREQSRLQRLVEARPGVVRRIDA